MNTRTQTTTKTTQTTALPWVVAQPDDAVGQFIAHLEAADRSPATVRAYRIGLATFQQWFESQVGRDFSAVAVTPLDVKLFRDWLRDTQKLAPASINNYLAGVRAFLGWALGAEIVTTNAAAQVRGVKTSEPVPQWLGRQEQYQLIRTCDELVQLGELRASGDAAAPGNVWPKRDRALVRLMLAAGLRRAEVCDLDVDDVVLRDRSGWVLVRNGKGGKARQVELNKDARKAVQSWLDVHPLQREGGVWAANTPLFVAQKGWQRLDKRSLADRIHVIATRARVAGVHPHTLRHTCAKNLIDAGVGIEKVAKLLGHSNLETTLIYTQPSQADLARAVELTSWED